MGSVNSSSHLCRAIAGICLVALGLSTAHANSSYSAQVESWIQSGAAGETQWLRLGRWQKRGLFGRLFRSRYLSEADGQKLFLDPHGRTDPTAELRATLLAFAEPLGGSEADHAQCLFPARRQWAERALNWQSVARRLGISVLECKERKAWKAQLDAEGLSLVFASAYLNNAASMFGHTFLKFHSRGNRDGKDLLDYGVNFAAETGSDGGLPFAAFGLTGFYKGYFSLRPFHQTLREYANIEGRDLFEYRLDFTPAEIDFFIDVLFELERTDFDYYFLSENCSYFLLAALEATRPSLALTDEFWYHVIPGDSVRIVSQSGIVKDTRYRASLATYFNRQKADATTAELEFTRTIIDQTPNPSDLPRKLEQFVQAYPQPQDFDVAKALDLAIDYGAVKAARDPNGYDGINHALRVRRAALGSVSRPVELATPARPEQGHDPGRVGLIVELPDTGSTRPRWAVQQRFAYHDRLSNDDGYLQGTTLEVLRSTLGAETTASGETQVRLRELTVLEILSAQPQDRFSRPLSWRTSFGIKEPRGTTSLGPYVNGGLGVTFGESWGWVSLFLDGETLANQDLPQPSPLWLGPRAIATVFLHRTLRLGTDVKLYRTLNGGPHFDAITTEAAWAPLRNFELRIGYQSSYYGNNGGAEWIAKVYQHILF